MTRHPRRHPGGAWDAATTEAVAALASGRAGLVFGPSRRDALELAARRAFARAGLASTAAWLTLLQRDGALLDDLLAELTVGETYFFRDAVQFDFLRREIVPSFAHRGAGAGPARLWSAACATGEEPYSLAILLREARLAGHVLGTDVARHRLVAARRARYRPWSLRGVDAATRRRWFRAEGAELWTLDPTVRAMVDFRHLNLADDGWPSLAGGTRGLDLVLCRNVLIYLDAATVARVAARLLASLADDGWLLLAATDPPLADVVRCEVVPTGSGLAYRRVARARATSGTVRGAPGRHAPFVASAWRAVHHEPVAAAAPPVTAVAPTVDAPTIDAPAIVTPAAPAAAQVVHEPPAAHDADVDACVARIRALANAGARDDAERACLAALDRHAEVAELHYLHAVLLADAGPAARHAALEVARRALYLDPQLAVARLLLAGVLQRLGRTAAAARALDEATRTLAALDRDHPVAGGDGEPAGVLLALARTQRALLRVDAA